uniref:SFRICE_005013 n=1 Tax=Spodoptera frugiperda TaxID=7108 RepID=A0A2H1VLW0_SPOFR
MKLHCQVEVINRLHSALNIRPSGKYLKSTLALIKEPKNENEYSVLLFSTVNKTGTKYRVKSVKQMFIKFINEGKATIRFEEPPHDLCIKCEHIQLKCFVKLLRSCIVGDTKAINLAKLSSVAVTHKESPTKMVIRDRSSFPNKGFPRTLESLSISGLNLCNFRRDILLLKQLVVLDLSNNVIEHIPPEFGNMPNLAELHLANNKLGVKGEIDWRWLLRLQVKNKLKLLDVTGNELKYLPKSIWKLQSLVTLKVDNNLLEYLPNTIGRMSNLRYLTIARNQLTSLPCSLLQCRLDYIDLSDNKLYEGDTEQAKILKNNPWEMYVNSLVDLAARVVVKQKISYAPNTIPWTLVEYLDDANSCVCGEPVMNKKHYSYKEFQLKDYFHVVVSDKSRKGTVSFLCYYCSPKCV